MHKLQLVAPLEEVYSAPNRLEQLEQYDKPEVLVYLPFAHGEHNAEPDKDIVPAGPEK